MSAGEIQPISHELSAGSPSEILTQKVAHEIRGFPSNVVSPFTTFQNLFIIFLS